MAQPKSANRPPVSAHPAFPAIVALWFAALLGIGSMMLPTILLERVVEAIGLPSIVEATTPPLAFGAKALIALAAAAIGAMCGLLIARKVVESNAATAQPRKRQAKVARPFEAPAKRPIVATEELGEEGLGPIPDAGSFDHYAENEGNLVPKIAMPPMPGRRRALSVTDDSGPSDFLNAVPLPGDHDPYRDDHIPPAVANTPSPRPFDLPVTMPVEAEAISRDGEVLHLAMPDEDSIMPEQAFPSSTLDLGPAEEAGPAFAPVAASFAPPASDSAPVPPTAATHDRARTLAELSMADLIARFGRALQAELQTEPPASEAFVETVSEEAQQPVAFTFQRAAVGVESAHEEPAPASSVQMFAASSAAAIQVPQALRPLDLGDFDEDGHDDDPFADDLGLPIGGTPAGRAFDQPVSDSPPAYTPFATVSHGSGDEDDDANEDAYSSLLSMKSPFGAGREFVRIEDEESEDAYAVPEAVVTFPGERQAAPAAFDPLRPFDAPQGPAPFAQPGSPLARAVPTTPAQRPVDAAETERALRDALEKLQRMSGAA